MKQWIVQKKVERLFGACDVNKDAMNNVAIFPKLRLAYNRIQKNANTSAMILLHELETGILEERDIAKENSTRLSSLPIMEIARLDKYRFFVIIRNPYSRLLSAFLDKFRKQKYKDRYHPFELTPAGFYAFVSWLENGGLHLNSHWDLQSKRILLPLHKYDGVVRFESLQEDMRSFLLSQSIALSQNALAELYPSDLTKKTSASSQTHLFYTDELAKRVYALFKEDFEKLQYSSKLPG